MDNQNYLGKGSYGTVYKENGVAVKKFSNLSCLIQEYSALKYLDSCKHVVHTLGVDYEKSELYMQLYDCSLRKFIDKNNYDQKIAMKLLKGVLIGLCEIHDKGLVHGDLKPANILVMKNNHYAVIADCGFVSVSHRAKVTRTSPLYKDPITKYDKYHDLFSLGVCMIELIGGYKPKHTSSYEKCQYMVKKIMNKHPYMKIVHDLFSEVRENRPTARDILQEIYEYNLPRWKYSRTLNYYIKSTDYPHYRSVVRKLIKKKSLEHQIKRSRICYGALLVYMAKNNLHSNLYIPYAAVTLMIASSLFGKSGFKEKEVLEICREIDIDTIHEILRNLLDDEIYLNMVLRPSIKSE